MPVVDWDTSSETLVDPIVTAYQAQQAAQAAAQLAQQQKSAAPAQNALPFVGLVALAAGAYWFYGRKGKAISL